MGGTIEGPDDGCAEAATAGEWGGYGGVGRADARAPPDMEVYDFEGEWDGIQRVEVELKKEEEREGKG